MKHVERQAAKPAVKAAAKNAAAKKLPTKTERRSQAERTEETRRKILDAAVALLASKGYAGFRTADVATAAGVSRGAQTHHFPSKDDLVVAVVAHVFERATEQGRKRAHRVHSVDEAIKALLTDSQEFFFSELFLIALDLAIQGRMRSDGSTQEAKGRSRVFLTPTGGGSPQGGGPGGPMKDISAATRLPVEAFWLAALVEAGVPKAVADDLLWLTISIVRGLAIRRLWQHDAPRFKRLFKLWRAMVASYLQALPHTDTRRTP